MITEVLATQPSAARRTHVNEEVDEIASALEEDILFGRIWPGARLIEDELITRFSTKRYAVREVLRRLEAIGVVSRSPNKGASVRNYTRKELEDINAVRNILAREAIALIPFPVDAASIDQIQAVQDRYAASVEANDLRAINHHNNEFHSALYALCGNAHLSGLINHYAWLTQVFRALSIVIAELRTRARDEHQAMIDALRSGAREQLSALCIEHMRPARQAFFQSRGWI